MSPHYSFCANIRVLIIVALTLSTFRFFWGQKAINLVQIWYDTHLFTLPPVMWAWCDAGHAFLVKSRYICTVNSNNEHYIFSLFITGPWRIAGAKFGVLSKEWVFNSLAFCTESSLAFCAESSNSPLWGAGRVIVGTSTRINIVALLEYFGQCGRRNHRQRIYIYIYMNKI